MWCTVCGISSLNIYEHIIIMFIVQYFIIIYFSHECLIVLGLNHKLAIFGVHLGYVILKILIVLNRVFNISTHKVFKIK